MSIEEAKITLNWQLECADKENKEVLNLFDKEAIRTLLTAYEQKCNYIKENEIYKKNLFNSYEEKCKELEKEKEKNKKLLEQNEDMKSLFNIQASIAKELDFNTNEKMVKFKDEYYVPDTMAINANIGEPKTIELRYISATKYLTKFDKEE